MQSHSIHYAGMRFRVVYNNIPPVGQSINQGYHTLITEVQQIGIFLADKLSRQASNCS